MLEYTKKSSISRLYLKLRLVSIFPIFLAICFLVENSIMFFVLLQNKCKTSCQIVNSISVFSLPNLFSSLYIKLFEQNKSNKMII